MNLEIFLQKVIQSLHKQNIQFALAGGLVASIYRTNPRMTNDIDLLFFSENQIEQKAQGFIQEFDLKAHFIRKADLEGGPHFARKRKTTPVYIIAGRKENKNTPIGLDVILPQMPWFDNALKRAQDNQIDFGFAKIPCITVEDLIISKIYSLQNNPQRFQDLDDLKSVFEAEHDLNIAYIHAQMKNLQLTFPKSIINCVPNELIKTIK